MKGDKENEALLPLEMDDNSNLKEVSVSSISGKEQITEAFEDASDKDEESDDNDIFINKSKNSRPAILSDSEDEVYTKPILSKSGSLDEEMDEEILQKVKSRIISNDSDSEDSCNNQESTQKSTVPKIQYRSDIFDTQETDDEDYNDDASTNFNDRNEDLSLGEMDHKDIDLKKKKNNIKKQSSKKRKEELREIHSTSQKMVRESEVVLPYHRPRQRTLMEFLSRKKNVPQFNDSSKKRKSLIMSMMDIQHLKEIEERKKDIDKFYNDEVDMEDNASDCETWNNVPATDINLEADSKNDITNMAADEDSLTELPDLDTFEKEDKKNAEEKKSNEEAESQTEDEQKNKEELNTEGDLKENLTVDSSRTVDTMEYESNTETLFINNDTVDNFSFQEKKISKDCEPDSNNEEKKNVSMVEKPLLFDEDSEDFKLHLNTEDFDDIIFDKENSTKQNSNEPGIDSLKGSSKSTDDPKCKSGITQRLSILATKFPQLDLGNLTCVTPKLSVGEGAFIELDDPGPVQETGVDGFLQRFFEHSKKTKTPSKPKNITLGIVSKEIMATGEEKLVHSNVTVKLEDEEDEETKFSTPGARLTLLKTTLKAKMLEQREKARQRREKEKEFMDSEKVFQDYHEDGLPDEEAELTDKSETDYETESEPEENDVIIKDKKRKKNKYLDEEAEVDEDEGDLVNHVENNEELENDISIEDGDVEDAESDTEMMDEDNSDKEEEKPGTRKRRSAYRVIEDDDDDDTCAIAYRKEDTVTESFKWRSEEDTQEVKEPIESGSKNKANSHSISRANTEELFSSQVFEESGLISKKESMTGMNGSMERSFDLSGSVIPAAQKSREGFELKNKENLDVSTSDILINSLTPFSKLKDTTQDIFTRENSDKLGSHSALNFLLTPMKTSQMPSSSNSQTIKRSLLLDTPDKSNKEEISTSNPDLLGLCSGTFATQNYPKASTEGNMEDLIGLCSGKFNTQRGDSPIAEFAKPIHSLTTSHADTVIISAETQGIDDVDSGQMREQKTLAHSSDEENLKEDKTRVKKKKKRKRILNLDLSDEEDQGNNAENERDSMEDEDTKNAWSSEEEELMEYDENEEPVVRSEKFNGFKDAFKGGIRSDFLDKEAELSGSEEGSDDEDEPDEDNDFMEQEEGDLERFDEQELRNQVGRAHLKSLIDNDKRELRLLQEIYLEDGDLHGEGRQRKFRWKNMDGQEDDENPISDGEEKEEEVEEEADWRKQRFEREKYLKEKNGEKEEVISSPLEEVATPSLESSSSLKLVRNLSIKRASTSSSHSTPSQEPQLLQNSLIKRGSFLSRDDTTLQRLASFTKEKENVTLGGARQGGNFVFQTLTVEEVEKKMEGRKEKRSTVKPPEKKRMRIERSFFSMEETVQSASVFKHL